MGSLVSFRRKLDSLVLEEVKQQAEQSWLSSQTMPTEIVDALVAEVERLQAMRVTKRQRLTEQGIRINRFEAALASAQENWARTQTKLTQVQAELNHVRQDARDQSDEIQELWLSPCEAEGLKRRLAEMEATTRIHEHALNERDKALAAEHQLRRETEQHYRAVLTMARNRGDRLEKTEALAALVTPQLARLLERLAQYWYRYQPDAYDQAEDLAARIREALEETE